MAAPTMTSTPMGVHAHLQKPVSRVTQEGRKLWYRLSVLQQPERARACGSGPKSTTDRRPVDPPPVIELRIFEGDSIETGKDITFTYDANFFLFAHLEHARHVANGRVSNPATTSPPVLTGMFVSGMAYLDRPREAGYFIFPDLSVRHEGRYKFIFSLFEQTKEDKDRDPGDGNEESFDHRLNIESQPFNVFSAKKFPGLATSTDLSRTFQEQGCRVRIRRDVRMRRRDGKASGGNDYDAPQSDDYRQPRTQTPEVQRDHYRTRSQSTSSVDRNTCADPYRRPSHHQPTPVPPYAAAPPTPTSTGSGHLQFGQPSGSQYPPLPHPSHQQQQPKHQYPPYTSHNQNAPPINSDPQHQQQLYTPISSRKYTFPQSQSQYPIPPSARPGPPRLAPAPMLPDPTEQTPPPSIYHNYTLPPTPTETKNQLPPLFKPGPPSRLPSLGQVQINSRKRSFVQTFPDDGFQQRLSNGTRQLDPHMNPPRRTMPGFDEPHRLNDTPLYYLRADGTSGIKEIPHCS